MKPAPHTVDLWCIELDRPEAEVHALAANLGPDEQARAGRFVARQHRHRFRVARGMLRRILSAYCAVAPEALEFRYGAHGKPELDRPGAPHFNLSHSGKYAMLAVTDTGPVGVDIELARPLRDMQAVARRFFSAAECEVFFALTPRAQRSAFYRCWTRKEAYIKALGTGLFTPLESFDVSLAAGQPARLLAIGGDAGAAAEWTLLDPGAPAGYAAALAVHARDVAGVRRRRAEELALLAPRRGDSARNDRLAG